MTLADDMDLEAERAKLIQQLADYYKRDHHAAHAVALVCDNVLDRSGGLLGKVREAARR